MKLQCGSSYTPFYYLWCHLTCMHTYELFIVLYTLSNLVCVDVHFYKASLHSKKKSIKPQNNTCHHCISFFISLILTIGITQYVSNIVSRGVGMKLRNVLGCTWFPPCLCPAHVSMLFYLFHNSTVNVFWNYILLVACIRHLLVMMPWRQRHIMTWKWRHNWRR